jgi:hypothetical protein
MMILPDFGIRGHFEPLSRARSFALEHLISFRCGAGDVRWAIVALALRSFIAVCVFGQRQCALLVRSVMGRAWQGARFAAGFSDAATMVAAGGR